MRGYLIIVQSAILLAVLCQCAPTTSFAPGPGINETMFLSNKEECFREAKRQTDAITRQLSPTAEQYSAMLNGIQVDCMVGYGNIVLSNGQASPHTAHGPTLLDQVSTMRPRVVQTRPSPAPLQGLTLESLRQSFGPSFMAKQPSSPYVQPDITIAQRREIENRLTQEDKVEFAQGEASYNAGQYLNAAESFKKILNDIGGRQIYGVNNAKFYPDCGNMTVGDRMCGGSAYYMGMLAAKGVQPSSKPYNFSGSAKDYFNTAIKWNYPGAEQELAKLVDKDNAEAAKVAARNAEYERQAQDEAREEQEYRARCNTPTPAPGCRFR